MSIPKKYDGNDKPLLGGVYMGENLPGLIFGQTRGLYKKSHLF